ncbi:MAG TPA: S24/S26 family peptidase [Xanthomonadaceae bacterium]|jgi:hypothetical protein
MAMRNSASETRPAALAIDALRAFGCLRLRADGTSMLPALHPGDVLDFASCAYPQVEPGEVVLFRRDDRIVIHRVVARTAAGLLTQGDGLAQLDAPVAAADLLGRLVGHSRAGRAIAPSRRPRRLPLTRWLFGRSTLAARIFLRWHRATGSARA